MRTRSRYGGRGVAAAVAIGLLAAACSSHGQSTDMSEPRLLPPAAYRALGDGTLYLLLGEPISANLWQANVALSRARQITFNAPGYGVSNFTASPAGIVLGDAASGVDVPELLRGRRLEQIGDGVGDPPVIAADGQIAMEYPSDGAKTGPGSLNRLVVGVGPNGPFRTIYSSRNRDPIPAAWGPDGMLAAVLSPLRGVSRVLIFNNRRQLKFTFGMRLGYYFSLQWGQAAYGIALTGSSGGGQVILNARGRTLARLPPGWFAQCWNPSGTALLMSLGSVVAQGSRSSQLGLWRPSQPDRVQPLGAIAVGPLVECSWLSRPARGGQPS
jgi:hypothetical protein